MSIEVKKLTHRCDPCHRRSKKCDRILPRCSACKLDNIECVFEREVKTFNHLYYIEDSISCFKVNKISIKMFENSTKEKKSKTTQKQKHKIKQKQKQDQNQKYKELNKNQVLRIERAIDLEANQALSIINMIQSKNSKENLLTLLQYPSLASSNSGVTLLVSLATSLGLFMKQYYKAEFQVYIPEGKGDEIKKITQEAFAYFFMNEHLIQPLFNTKTFKITTCDKYTRMAILACGLKYLPKNELVNSLSTYFEEQLYKYFKCPYRVKPTLDNLRTAFMLFVSLRNFKWVLKLSSALNNYISIHLITLGLHLPNAYFNSELQLNRQMLYNLICFFSNFVSLTSYPSLANTPLYPKKYHLSFKLQNPRYFQISTKFNKTLDSINLYSKLFNEYLGILGKIFYKISALKFNIVLRIASFKSQLTNIKKLLYEHNNNSLKYLAIFYQLKNNDSKFTNEDLLIVYESCIQVFNSFVNFFTLSFNTYHANSLNALDTPDSIQDLNFILPNSKQSTFLSAIIYEAIQVVKLCTKIPPKFINSTNTAIISQSLVFLIKNTNVRYQTEINQVLQIGKQLLSTLKGAPYNNVQAYLNLLLIEKALAHK